MGMEVEGEGGERSVEGRRVNYSGLTDGNKGRCARKGKDQIDYADFDPLCIFLETQLTRHDSHTRPNYFCDKNRRAQISTPRSICSGNVT